jgi:hypothetical protein
MLKVSEENYEEDKSYSFSYLGTFCFANFKYAGCIYLEKDEKGFPIYEFYRPESNIHMARFKTLGQIEAIVNLLDENDLFFSLNAII